MKSSQGLTVAFALMFAASFLVNCGYVWHMAGLYERLNQAEAKRISPPTQKEVAEYIETHKGSAPPASWYPNGDPWRNFTAREANEMLKDCEVKGGR
jgi:hypothetical protein